MTARDLLKGSNLTVSFVQKSRRIYRKIRRRFPYNQIGRYAESHQVRKLQIGSGPSALPGWLNTDLNPRTDEVVFLDATKPFPIDDGTFDYVYSEHMLEHISWQNALAMLRECHRVLKPAGTIRIATPDLEVLLGLNKTDDLMAQKYIKWITDQSLEGISVCKVSFVINNAFYNWGHQFLYDGETLEMTLQEAGFIETKRCSPGESDDEVLRDLEFHGKNIGDEEMNVFETLVYEAKS